MKLVPVPVAGEPPVAVQEKVTGGVPPLALAEHVTAVPTVPVAGQLIVTVSAPPTVWDAVATLAFASVTLSLTVKGPVLA